MQLQLFLTLLTIMGVVSAQDASDPLVAQPGDRIVFDRLCATEERHRLGSYAIMATEDQATRALVQVFAGFYMPTNPQVSIGLHMLEFDLKGGAEWASVDLSLQLLASDGEFELASQRRNYYHSSLSGDIPEELIFQTNESGRLRWHNFAEPGNTQTKGDDSYNFIEGLTVPASELVQNNASAEFSLNLKLLRNDGKAEMLLAGPVIRVPDAVWEIEPPEFRVLGLLDTLNPTHQGGLFDWLGSGFKYRNCIDERREARISYSKDSV